MKTKDSLKTYFVEVIVKVRNHRGKRFWGNTRASSADEAKLVTLDNFYLSLSRAYRGIQKQDITIRKVSYASDFYIEQKDLFHQ